MASQDGVTRRPDGAPVTAPVRLRLEAVPDGTSGVPARRVWPRLLAVLAAAAVVASGLAWVALPPAAHRDGDNPVVAARRFLDRYVTADGRVSRIDQGGDTVSEGQAYAMLLAVGAGDDRRFALAWSWARDHLQRDDGLLAWRWQGGQVADWMPAADADLDAAWALVLAADRFRVPRYQTDAASMAAGILAAETWTVGGRPLLVAGPWARTAPFTVNPSYLAPGALSAVGRASGDRRWAAMTDASRAFLATITAGGGRLPPDWATLAGGTAGPSGPPGRTSDEPTYGLQAQRILPLLAGSCEAVDRRLAGSLWSVMPRDPQAQDATAAGLDGRSLTNDHHPLGLLALAAAAGAAGRRAPASDLLARAARAERQRPTYYGAAWLALTGLLLERSPLHPCPAVITP